VTLKKWVSHHPAKEVTHDAKWMEKNTFQRAEGLKRQTKEKTI
jgi:hypothetical protein